ncbi:hypothetical protein FACS189421_13580 [Bacteroidia bacterium]|nr:hypothetical protein FACS189421_13580 [Bacteroidia bacterium]
MKIPSMIKRWSDHIVSVVTNPKKFFTKIVADGNMEESMLKAFFYGLLGGALVLLIRSLTGNDIGFSILFVQLIVVPVLAVVLLFVLSGLLMMISEITGGERDWEIAVKGLASVFFMYPVILVLNSLAWNCASLWAASIIVDAYVLFLIYNIAIYCMKGKRVLVTIVIGVFALFIVTIYSTQYRYGWFDVKNHLAMIECKV